MGTMTGSAERLGRQAENSDWLDHAIRVGLVAYGLVHLMIAWLASDDASYMAGQILHPNGGEVVNG